MAINEVDKRGLQRPGTSESDFNQLEYAIEQYLNNEVTTSWIGRIDSVTTEDGESGSGCADITPLTSQADAEGRSLPSVSVPQIPHTRLQSGIAAVIINPVPGDRVVCVSCKSDISTIDNSTEEPQRAGSFRTFDQSDSVAVGTIHTQKPTVYIELKQDNTIKIKAPEGVTIETDNTVTVKAKEIKVTADKVTYDTPLVHMTHDLKVDGHIYD